MVDFDRLESLIEASGKTKAYLCKAAGKARSYIVSQKAKTGNIPQETLEIFARELETTTEYLRGEVDTPTRVDELAELREKLARLSKEGQAKAEAYLDFLLSQES